MTNGHCLIRSRSDSPTARYLRRSLQRFNATSSSSLMLSTSVSAGTYADSHTEASSESTIRHGRSDASRMLVLTCHRLHHGHSRAVDRLLSAVPLVVPPESPLPLTRAQSDPPLAAICVARWPSRRARPAPQPEGTLVASRRQPDHLRGQLHSPYSTGGRSLVRHRPPTTVPGPQPYQETRFARSDHHRPAGEHSHADAARARCPRHPSEPVPRAVGAYARSCPAPRTTCRYTSVRTVGRAGLHSAERRLAPPSCDAPQLRTCGRA